MGGMLRVASGEFSNHLPLTTCRPSSVAGLREAGSSLLVVQDVQDFQLVQLGQLGALFFGGGKSACKFAGNFAGRIAGRFACKIT
jgi:hypothetical protein